MALPKVPEEREQGAVQEQEMIEAGNPTPPEETPAAQDEAVVQAAVDTAEAVAQGAQPEQMGQQPAYTVRNPHMLLPSNANFGRATGQRRKTPAETSYDAGLLFRLLAKDNPMFKLISEQLTGAGRGLDH